MKRSAGVGVASICVIAASVAYCVYVIWTLPPLANKGLAFLVAGSVFELLFGVWGIVTGIGLLRLRRWAWACVLVISAVMILFSVPELLRAPRLIRATTGVPTISAGHFVLHQYVHLIALGLVPVILGIWWIVLFLRRSVRLQFAGPFGEGAEGKPIGSRSGAVDASAIVLFFGSALVFLFAVMMPLTAYTAPLPQSAPAIPFRGMLIGVAILYALIAAWGIVTGIGVMKRRGWGRILMIVTGAIGVAFSILGSAGAVLGTMITPADPRTGSALDPAITMAILIVLIPLGISIWWLVLFTRPRIALEFASGGAALAATPPTSSTLAAQPEPAAPAISVPLQFAATASVPAPFVRPQIPISIRVIAVLEILFGALALFAPLQVKSMGMKPSLLIFGVLAHGWSVDAFYLASGILPIAFCIAILLRKRWGLDALIAFLLASIANVALTFVSPARARWNAEVRAQMQSVMPQIKMPDGSAPPPSPIFTHMNLFYGFVFGTTIVLYAVLLYFLFTRRRGFRDACRPSNLGPNAALDAAGAEGSK